MKKILILSGIALLALQSLSASVKISPEMENSLIMEGILYDEMKNFAKSQEIYLKLFDSTHNPEYLIQASRENILSEKEVDRKLLSKMQNWLKKHPDNRYSKETARLLTLFYARNGDLKRANTLAQKWLSNSKELRDLQLLGAIKLDLKDYKGALEVFKRAYNLTKDEKFLLEEVSILANYLNRLQDATSLLETHLKIDSNASKYAYMALIKLYAKENNISKILSVYKRLYEKKPSKAILNKIIKLSLYIRDFRGLSDFLEKYASKSNETLLYSLYKEEGRYNKAISLAQKRYVQTHNPKWLAEEAILIYEDAKAKDKITPKLLKRFNSLFDKAIKEGAKKPLYLNYYGYILINKRIDIKRGLKLVKEALKEKPDNAYYLDSLALGLYLQKRCKEAYEIMRRVMKDSKASKEPEIIEHWKKIKECIDKSKNKE